MFEKFYCFVCVVIVGLCNGDWEWEWVLNFKFAYAEEWRKYGVLKRVIVCYVFWCVYCVFWYFVEVFLKLIWNGGYVWSVVNEFDGRDVVYGEFGFFYRRFYRVYEFGDCVCCEFFYFFMSYYWLNVDIIYEIFDVEWCFWVWGKNFFYFFDCRF